MADTEVIKVALMEQAILQIQKDTSEIRVNVKEMRAENQQHYVSREEFDAFKREQELIKKIVYGFVGLVLVSVVTAMLTLVLRK